MDSSLFARVEPQLQKIEDRFLELEALISDPDVATDGARMAAILRERGKIAETVSLFRELKKLAQEIDDAKQELANANGDEGMRGLAQEVLEELQPQWAPKERALLSDFTKDPDDGIASAIMEIRAGTGGDEATLWAGELLRMYSAVCDRRRWKVEMMDLTPSAMKGGVKEAVLNIKGEGAYAALKYESGGHRVQRVPETESQGRIHTSAATVAVLPEATEVDVRITEADLRIDTFRSSGPGGQSVNKTSSAIRITHVPTGLVVSCQDEKSQHKNKAKALKILRTRLYDVERQKQHAERSSQRKLLIGSGDRSERIRTYNFPQTRVTDHRIKVNLHNLQAVLDGELDELIESLAEYDREQRLQDLAGGL
ncbi:MAG: peptide chain release factor 1 [Planctomycetes bacterium]|nr:peptide chain release factor 1 [Planctomycetota bacterium]